MAGFDVAELSALEILDSRGRPTLAVTGPARRWDHGPGRGAVGRVDGLPGGRRAA